MTDPCPVLLRGCALLGFLGALALVGGNIVATLVAPGHDWAADTVSDLAAGRYESIQDVSLHGYAAALLATAIGAAHRHMDGLRWSGDVFCLALLALLVSVIGARNEYGDGDGVVVHIYLVIALGFLFALAPLLMWRGIAAASQAAGRVALGAGLFWVVGGPLFFLLPTAYDGARERLLGLVSALWLTTLAAVFWRQASAGE